MQLRKYRWSKDYESAEEALVDWLNMRQVKTERWTADEFEDLGTTTNVNDRKLWCAEGSLIITVEGKRFSLQTGDALDIPSNTSHQINAGISGCACYEAV